MNWIIVGAVIAVGLFLSAFFSGAETGLYRVNHLRLHLGVQRRDPKALRLSRVLGDEQGALSVTLIGTNVMNYVTTIAVAYLFADLLGFSEADTELYTVTFLTPIVFVFGEVVPKNLFRLHPDRLLARGSGLLALSNRLFRMTGAVAGLKLLAAVINRPAGGLSQRGAGFAPKRRIAMLLQEALAGNTLGEDQSDLIDRVCGLSETPLHAVMVPRNRVTAVAANADRRELVRVARRTGHARFPVYEPDRRHIIGLIKVDELLPSSNWQTVGERLRPATTMSPHETVATAITRLQRAGRGMAVVTDHGGQMLGVVTLKDLLSEVVGEVAAGV
ncbi:MAG: CNNM domain-containing protein [Phycisphaerae bacterium]